MPLPKRFFSLITIALLFTCPQLAGQAVTNEFYLYEDSAKQLTGETAIQLFKQGKFTKAEKRN